MLQVLLLLCSRSRSDACTLSPEYIPLLNTNDSLPRRQFRSKTFGNDDTGTRPLRVSPTAGAHGAGRGRPDRCPKPAQELHPLEHGVEEEGFEKGGGGALL